MAVLKRFIDNVENLNSVNAHSLVNVMTMELNSKPWFERLEMWFKATVSIAGILHDLMYLLYSIWLPGVYQIRTADEGAEVPEMLKMASQNFAVLPVHYLELLALHAPCAKVTYLLSAREHSDDLDEDVGDLSVLACDGGSSDVLNHTLSEFTIP